MLAPGICPKLEPFHAQRWDRWGDIFWGCFQDPLLEQGQRWWGEPGRGVLTAPQGYATSRTLKGLGDRRKMLDLLQHTLLVRFAVAFVDVQVSLPG